MSQPPRRRSWPSADLVEDQEPQAPGQDQDQPRHFAYSIRSQDLGGSSADSGLILEEFKIKGPPANSVTQAKKAKVMAGEDGVSLAMAEVSAGTARKRRIAGIFQHYYPEGGWGWVIVTCATLAQMLVTGFQFSFGVIVFVIQTRFRVSTSTPVVLLGSMSVGLTWFISPLTIGVCRRKSTRLTAVLGGLVVALGCLFSSFANQFHQLFLSYALLVALGTSMVKEPCSLMIAQFFKRRRALVEMISASGIGIGIALMSSLLHECIRDLGWRLGLQVITGLLFSTFVIGTFYRSASLYHPQRRAILHLKSQKRKIKNKDKEKNKAQDDRPAYFDFSTLKSRTIQILLLSVAISAVGLYTPILLVVQQALQDRLDSQTVLSLQVHLGLAWALGCFVWGFIIITNSKECHISKQYLCQTSLTLTGLAVLAFISVQGHRGYVLFCWIYGLFLGGHFYALRMYVFEKVRARNFSRAWGFIQLAIALPALAGPPLSDYLNQYYGGKTGFIFSGFFIVMGSLTMSLITMHRRSLRRRNKAKKKAATETQVLATPIPTHVLLPANSSSAGSGSHSGVNFLHDLSSPVTNHFIKKQHQSSALQDQAMASHHKSLSLVDEAIVVDQASDFSEEDPAEMGIPDHLLLEELEFLDNITSCNKVENCVMLSEYEQNLIKETESPEKKMVKRWSSLFVTDKSNNETGTPKRYLGVGGLRQSSFTSSAKSSPNHEIPLFLNNGKSSKLLSSSKNNKRTITVIEEASV